MIPLTFIDRPKLSEQKKPFENIVSPTSGIGTNIGSPFYLKNINGRKKIQDIRHGSFGNLFAANCSSQFVLPRQKTRVKKLEE